MPVWKKNLILIWLSQFFGMTGFWFAMPFIPFYIQELGATEIADRNLWVSIYSAVGYMSVGIFAPIWGHVADRFGRRLMLLRANFCNSLIIPLMAFAPNLFVLIFLRFLLGVFSGTISAAQTLVSSETPVEKRGFAIGMVSSGVFSGSMAGCFLGGIVVDSFGYKTGFIICGFLYFLSGLLILLGVKENFLSPRVAVAPRKRKRFFINLDPLKTAWLILALVLVMGFARQFDAPFFPLLVQKIHGSIQGAATWTGIVSSAAAVAGMLAGPILGLLADKISAPRVALLSALFAGIFMLPQGLAECMGMLAFGRFFMIFFAGGLDPVFQIWLAKSTPDKIRGVIFGWALTAKCVGWVIAAALSGIVATFIGLRWVYGAGCLFFWLLIPLIKYTASRLEGRGD